MDRRMKHFKIKNNRGDLICEKCICAESFFDRAKGLMFSDKIPEGGDGMLISPCNSIHTFFMRYDLDIIFLNANFEVIKIIKKLSPWKMTWIYLSARHVLELKSKDHINIKEGDVLEVLCIN